MSFNEIDNQPDMDIVNSFLERVELLNSKPGEWFIGIACDVIKDVHMTHGINLNSESVFVARAADEKAAKILHNLLFQSIIQMEILNVI